MGGSGSGRYGGRPTVEKSLTLDLPRLFKEGWLKPGAPTSGVLRWTRVSIGRETASMGFQSELSKDDGYVDLYWTSTDRQTGETRQCEDRISLTTSPQRDRISLTTSPQPFGGRRWFFVCPRTGETVAKVHLPTGSDTFASRKAHRLGYRSQRESPRDRSFSRVFSLREKLTARGKGAIGSYIAKPKGMHWRTFERAMQRVYVAEQIVGAHAAVSLARLTKRLPLRL